MAARATRSVCAGAARTPRCAGRCGRERPSATRLDPPPRAAGAAPAHPRHAGVPRPHAARWSPRCSSPDPRPSCSCRGRSSCCRGLAPRPLVLDVGTGSGCIARRAGVGAARRPRRRRRPRARGGDRASRTSAALGLGDRVTRRRGRSVRGARRGTTRADLVVSNPPYVPTVSSTRWRRRSRARASRGARRGARRARCHPAPHRRGAAPARGGALLVTRDLVTTGGRGHGPAARRGFADVTSRRDSRGRPLRERPARAREASDVERLEIEGGATAERRRWRSARPRTRRCPALAAALLTAEPLRLPQRARARRRVHDGQAARDARARRSSATEARCACDGRGA